VNILSGNPGSQSLEILFHFLKMWPSEKGALYIKFSEIVNGQYFCRYITYFCSILLKLCPETITSATDRIQKWLDTCLAFFDTLFHTCIPRLMDTCLVVFDTLFHTLETDGVSWGIRRSLSCQLWEHQVFPPLKIIWIFYVYWPYFSYYNDIWHSRLGIQKHTEK
jgi:hypothetical protein